MAKKKTKKPLSKKQLKRRKRKRILIIEIVVLLILLIALGIWLWLGKIDWNDIKKVNKNKLDDGTQEVLDEYTCIALFGVDNRKAGNYKDGRSDSMMIACINNETHEVKLLSIYRDTMLDTGKGALKKCNAAYGAGGPEQALEMINKNLDLDVQEYIAVDFNALADVIDALGGVEIDVDSAELRVINAYVDETASLVGGNRAHVTRTGLQTLNGVQATAYCRIRYTAGDDFKRTSRQREVLTKLAEKASHMTPAQAVKVANGLVDEISTSLSMKQIAALAKDVKKYKLVETAGFPFDKTTGNFGKRGSLVVPCTLSTNVVKLHEDLFNHEDYTPTSEVREISNQIQNATGKGASDAVEYKEYEY